MLPLVEDVLLVESTGNRPDLLSIYGLAREVAALYELELAPPAGVRHRDAARTRRWTSTVEDFEGCPRYIGRVFRDVALGPSPVWLRARLATPGCGRSRTSST